MKILHYLIQEAPNYLKLGGWLWLEQGYDQSDSVLKYLKQYGYTNIQQYYGSNGILRVSSGQKSS